MFYEVIVSTPNKVNNCIIYDHKLKTILDMLLIWKSPDCVYIYGEGQGYTYSVLVG